MRTVSRKNFEELRKFNQLSDKEKSKMKGGNFYYDTNGNFLGQIGSGPSLQFVDQSTFNQFKSAGFEGTGTSFNNVSQEAKINFIESLWGSSNVIVYPDLRLPSGALAAANTDTKELLFAGNAEFWGNYYNIISTIQHEKYHVDNPSLTGAMGEVYALMYQRADSSYQNVSTDYRQATDDLLRDQMKNAGYTQSQIDDYFNSH